VAVNRAVWWTVLTLVAGAGVVSCSSSAPAPAGVPASSMPTVPPVPPAVVHPVAGTPGWQLSHPGPEHAIEGYLDRVSVLPGESTRLFVSTTAARFTVTAYRMGAYQGSDALRVWQSGEEPGVRQAAHLVAAPTSTVTAPWQPSLTVNAAGWAPGDYLLRLDAKGGNGDGAQQYVPLTVRTPSNQGRVVIINAVTTWQAYNRWGGYSLYDAPDGKKAHRSRAVSFDRPYQAQTMQGAGDFLYFELPLLRFAEQRGLSLGYATDVDLHADPHLLDGARAMVTLGHDEYWSSAMRANVTAARDHGTNLIFLGGNEIYRHIRMDGTGAGPDRLEVDYKSFREDPYSRTNPAEATPEWRSPPLPRPESMLLGNFYHCNPAHSDLVVADDTSWLLTGIVHNGQKLPGLVGNEYESLDLSVPTPRPIQVLFHSPVTCQGRPDFADVTYYTTPSGAGVFSAGTQYWICALDDNCGQDNHDATAHAAITAITARMLDAFAGGPVGQLHPAADNLATLHIAPPHGAAVPPAE
jgi:hypothetical protein